MLVARTNPLLVFHYNFGYVKRCGEFYDENKFNREDLFRHITEQEFQKKQDDFTGSAAAQLMSIEDLDKYLQENYGIPAFRLNFWQQVKSICMEAGSGQIVLPREGAICSLFFWGFHRHNIKPE